MEVKGSSAAGTLAPRTHRTQMTGTAPAPFHLVSFGEAMVRLCPPSYGRLEVATTLEMQPGGAELNTAVGFVRLGLDAGLRAAWVSRLPANALGRFIGNKAREQGVNTD